MTRQKRTVSYQWRLREVMAEHDMYATTELVPLLAERGIVLSASQVHRLVTSTPERLSLPILAALCDIFTVEPGDLIITDATSVGVRAAAAGDRPAPEQHRPAATAAGPDQRHRTSCGPTSRVHRRRLPAGRIRGTVLRPLPSAAADPDQEASAAGSARPGLGGDQTLARGPDLLGLLREGLRNLRHLRQLRHRPAAARDRARRPTMVHRLRRRDRELHLHPLRPGRLAA